MSDKFYCGPGCPEMFDEYMDFINYVFGFNGNQKDFKKLLPKLYKPEYDPAGHSMVVTEDGKIKAAIGAFDSDISVCGETVKTRGIGNVAVHPYSRSKGYMIKCMEAAIDKMIEDGVALTVLGGRRQRYNYFSYDSLGSVYSLTVNADNFRHRFGRDAKIPFTYRKLVNGIENAADIENIRRLSQSQPYYGLRNNADYFSILISWQSSVTVCYEGDNFVGYFVGDEEISEFLIVPSYEERTVEIIAGLYKFLGTTLSVKVPEFNYRYVDCLCDFCESISTRPSKMFSVLNYEKVTGAFMKLKASYTDLPDGKLTVAVDGRACYEKITLEVAGGKPSVYAAGDAQADYSFGHLDGMRFLFGNYSPARHDLPDFAKIWLPLPIFQYAADAV